jgi:repressor LexA
MNDPSHAPRPLPSVPLGPNEQLNSYRTQCRVLTYVHRYITAHPWPPTLREIKDALKLPSTDTVHKTLRRLKEKGLVTWTPRQSRSLRIIYNRKET